MGWLWGMGAARLGQCRIDLPGGPEALTPFVIEAPHGTPAMTADVHRPRPPVGASPAARRQGAARAGPDGGRTGRRP